MLMLTLGVLASCQNAAPDAKSGTGSPSNTSSGGAVGAGGGEFQTHKSEILNELNKALAEIQKRESCIQVANNPQALGACMEQDPKEFQARKSEISKRLNDTGADRQKRSCVQAANDQQALAACLQR